MFDDVLSVINILKTILYYIFYYSFKTGQSVVNAFNLISESLLKVLKTVSDVIVIILESFSIFCQDIIQGLYQTEQFLSIVGSSIYSGIWTIYSVFLNVSNSIIDGYYAFQNFILTVATGMVTICKLFKHLIILFGSGVWFTITLIPYSIWNLVLVIIYIVSIIPQLILSGIINAMTSTKNYIVDICVFIIDVPIESVFGILISGCLIYVLTQFYVIIFSYLFSTFRMLFLYIINKFYGVRNFSRNSTAQRLPVAGRSGIKKTNTGLEKSNERFCVICQEKLKCILLLPCRHVCLCNDCNARLQLYNNTCPLCRNYIESTMQIFV